MRSSTIAVMTGTRELPWILLTLCVFLTPIYSATIRQTMAPIFHQKAVLLVWDPPEDTCKTTHNISLGLKLSFFKDTTFGLYPYYKKDGSAINEGLPQNSKMADHLAKVKVDITKIITMEYAKGLSVIDWRKWDPLFNRNTGGKEIYRTKSDELVKEKNPNVTANEGTTVGQAAFEEAAKTLMLKTLQTAKAHRRNQLWGYFMFPSCNKPNSDTGAEFGDCTELETKRNDRLRWLWDESTALFPFIPVQGEFNETLKLKPLPHQLIKEAMRLSIPEKTTEFAKPVFAFVQPTHPSNKTILSEADIISTIGESVALGVAGVILWGDSSYETNDSCTTYNSHLTGPLGKYLLNVTTAAQECSEFLCNQRGRCLRKNANENHYLHVTGKDRAIKLVKDKLELSGNITDTEKEYYKKHFACQCYNGANDKDCDKIVPTTLAPTTTKKVATTKPKPKPKTTTTTRPPAVKKGKAPEKKKASGAPSITVTWSQILLLPLGLLRLLH